MSTIESNDESALRFVDTLAECWPGAQDEVRPREWVVGDFRIVADSAIEGGGLRVTVHRAYGAVALHFEPGILRELLKGHPALDVSQRATQDARNAQLTAGRQLQSISGSS